MKKWTLAVTLLLASCAVAQQAPSALHGSWIATAGPSRFLRGRWSAQVLPATKNAANGSWRFSAKVTKSFWKALGQPRNQRAAGEVPGQPEYTRAGPSLVRGTLRRRTSMARPLKTCSNGLLRNKLAAPGKAVVLRGIGGFSVDSSVHACARLPIGHQLG